MLLQSGKRLVYGRMEGLTMVKELTQVKTIAVPEEIGAAGIGVGGQKE